MYASPRPQSQLLSYSRFSNVLPPKLTRKKKTPGEQFLKYDTNDRKQFLYNLKITRIKMFSRALRCATEKRVRTGLGFPLIHNVGKVPLIQANKLVSFLPSMVEYKSTSKTHPPCHNLSSGRSYSLHLKHRENILITIR